VSSSVVSAAASPNTAERLNRVLELLEQQATVQVTELAHRFDVSEVTVRSDLTRLAGQGLVARFRGGARLAEAPASEVGFDLRVRLREPEKRAIARGAATMVENGDAVALDSSTTAYYVALELRTKSELVVVTNGLRVAAALGDASGVTVIVPGGTFRPAAASLLGDFATGSSPPGDDDRKRLLRSPRNEHRARADGSRPRRGSHPFAPRERIDAIITDSNAPLRSLDEWRAALAAQSAPRTTSTSGPNRLKP
jgi:DeoR/GlpR family transcriptional regulator of sugar metabolism